MKTRWVMVIGQRTVLARTCWRCGKFKQGSDFARFPRRGALSMAYIDRRCGECRWRHLVRA